MTTWNDTPICFVTRASCPACGCCQYIAIRSMPRESDGSKTLRVVCRRCSGRFLIVSEPPEENFARLPEFGNSRCGTDIL